MSWDEKTINIIIGLLVMIATGITAWATTKQLRLNSRIYATSAPTVSAELEWRDKAPHPMRLSARVDESHSEAWRISSITIWPPWWPLLAKIGESIRDESGAALHYKADKWNRTLIFDPPVSKIPFLAAHNVSKIVQLRFELASRADSKIKSRCVTRIKTRD